MRKAGKGAIVHVASIGGLAGSWGVEAARECARTAAPATRELKDPFQFVGAPVKEDPKCVREHGVAFVRWVAEKSQPEA